MEKRKKRVYIESSVISYLTARPSRDIIISARQEWTRVWWERRLRWDVFVSPLVLDEISLGDSAASRMRLEIADGLPAIGYTNEATRLADLLVKKTLVPAGSHADALHLALAAVHGMDYLITWNQKHLNNMELRGRIYAFLEKQGVTPAQVGTPEQLLEGVS